MKKTLLLSIAIASQILVNAQTRVQVIHNCADLAADSVDVYLGSTKLLDNFAFRTATPFIDAPAGVPITIGIATKNSTSVTDTIYSVTVTLDAAKKYIIVANGIVSPSGYTPGAMTVPFRLSVFDMARETAGVATNTDVLVMHGSTDAPTVDVKSGSSTLVNDISFGQFCSTGYLNLPTANYTIDVTTSAGTTIVKRYSAPLATLGLTDSALTVLASGFLDSTVNSNGRSFGLWVALRMGGALIPLPEAPVTAVNNIAQSGEAVVYPNPAQSVVYFNNGNATAVSVSLLDVTGKVIAEEKNTVSGSFNVANLSNGLYFIRTVNERGTSTMNKFIKN